MPVPAARHVADLRPGIRVEKIVPRQLHPLLHTGGESLDEAIALFVESHLVEHIRGALARNVQSLQALQFKIADMATELDASRLLVARAAWARDRAAGTGARTTTSRSARARPLKQLSTM